VGGEESHASGRSSNDHAQTAGVAPPRTNVQLRRRRAGHGAASHGRAEARATRGGGRRAGRLQRRDSNAADARPRQGAHRKRHGDWERRGEAVSDARGRERSARVAVTAANRHVSPSERVTWLLIVPADDDFACTCCTASTCIPRVCGSERGGKGCAADTPLLSHSSRSPGARRREAAGYHAAHGASAAFPAPGPAGAAFHG
jgi:hypothetical protein